MPIVPKVDVYRTGTFCNKKQEVHAQADGNDKRTHGCVISHGGGSRPSHIEHTELQVVESGDLTQRTTKVVRQQGRHNAKAHKTDTHVKS